MERADDLPGGEASTHVLSRASYDTLARLPVAARHVLLRKALADIVRRSSREQTLKGLATAGFRKSARYAVSKIRKALGR